MSKDSRNTSPSKISKKIASLTSFMSRVVKAYISFKLEKKEREKERARERKERGGGGEERESNRDRWEASYYTYTCAYSLLDTNYVA